jgi:hypothetical protein
MATMPAWQAVNARGVCVVEGEMSHRFQMREILAGTLPVELQVMVAAPGYVPLYFGRAANPRETINATLKPARSFELRLLTADGEPVNLQMGEDLYQEHRSSPLLIGSVDGAPVCALGEQQSERFRASGAPPLCLNFGIYPLGDGRYRVDVPQAFTGKLLLMVHSPEVIRYYLRTLEPERVAIRHGGGAPAQTQHDSAGVRSGRMAQGIQRPLGAIAERCAARKGTVRTGVLLRRLCGTPIFRRACGEAECRAWHIPSVAVSVE